MKTGIIGLPQVGKTSLFKILTKAKLEERAHSRQEHIGVARVPDERLEKLSALYSPKKTTFASVEFVDVAAIGQEALKETAFLASLRQVDALIHVLRAFEDDAAVALAHHPGMKRRVGLLVRRLRAVDLRRHDGVGKIKVTVAREFIEAHDVVRPVGAGGGEHRGLRGIAGKEPGDVIGRTPH